MYIPVFHTNRRSINNTFGVVIYHLVGMGLKIPMRCPPFVAPSALSLSATPRGTIFDHQTGHRQAQAWSIPMSYYPIYTPHPDLYPLTSCRSWALRNIKGQTSGIERPYGVATSRDKTYDKRDYRVEEGYVYFSGSLSGMITG